MISGGGKLWATVFVLLAAMITGTAARAGMIAPAEVRAQPDGRFQYDWVFFCEDSISIAGLGWLAVTNTTGATHGDCFCGPFCNGNAGDSLRWHVSGRLTNPAIDGIAGNWLAGCFTAGATTHTRVLSHLTAGVETPKGVELRLWSSPNPGHGETTIFYTLPASGPVTLDLFDVAGRRVATPVREIGAVGTRQVRWRPDRRAVGAGGSSVFLARLEFGGEVCRRRIVVIR